MYRKLFGRHSTRCAIKMQLNCQTIVSAKIIASDSHQELEKKANLCTQEHRRTRLFEKIHAWVDPILRRDPTVDICIE